MSKVRHRNICRLVDSFVVQGNKLCLIMEYCDRGDLSQYLSRFHPTTVNTPLVKLQSTTPAIGATSVSLTELGEPKVWRFFLQICQALELIHSKGIVHADLKPQNLLLTGRDHTLKITDFGVSRLRNNSVNPS